MENKEELELLEMLEEAEEDVKNDSSKGKILL
jgi:hypothetical protein